MESRLDFICKYSQVLHQNLCELLFSYQMELRNPYKNKDAVLEELVEQKLKPSIDLLSQLKSKTTDPRLIDCKILFDLYPFVSNEMKPRLLALLVGLDFQGTSLMTFASNLAMNIDVNLAYDLPKYLYDWPNARPFSNSCDFYQYQLNLLNTHVYQDACFDRFRNSLKQHLLLASIDLQINALKSNNLCWFFSSKRKVDALLNLKQLISDPAVRAKNNNYDQCQTIDDVIDQWLQESHPRRFHSGNKTINELIKEHRNFFSICTFDTRDTKTYQSILNLKHYFGVVALSKDSNKLQNDENDEAESLFVSSIHS